MTYWTDKYYTPENICVNCGHARKAHLDQPFLKGEPPSSDRGWCTLPEGSCIHSPCDCMEFIEPKEPTFAANEERVTKMTIEKAMILYEELLGSEEDNNANFERVSDRLIDLVIQASNTIATTVNSQDALEQIRWLFGQRFTEDEIREFVGRIR